MSTKKEWQECLLSILEPLKAKFSADSARIVLDGGGTTYPQRVIELEAFARPLWGLVPFWYGGGHEPFFEKQYLDEYLNVWKKIARRFKGSPVIHGYSVMNEPSQSGRVVYDYLLCQYLAAKAIREIDPDIPVFIAANNWDKPDAFPYLKPLPLKNIYYEVHMYDPYAYTHQGVGTTIENIKKGKYFVYPGKIGGSFYNRATLRNILQPVVDFQKKYGAKIYCGEFSVIRWAPGAAQYLEDLCSIFEELGWDWAYHCYREWENWSFEYPDSFQEKTPAKSPTARHLVLRKYWKRNASPYTGRK